MSLRKPIFHEITWEEDYSDLTPKQLSDKIGTSSSELRKQIGLQNYDVIINDNESGYRNEGVYIYNDNEIHPLSVDMDDYGTLPDWVEIRKEDCGHSYFSDYLIVHNTYVPFKTNDWQIGKSYVDEEIKPFKFAYKNINVKTDLHRIKDGAKATVNYSVMISAPWLGGPTEDVEEGGGGGDGNKSYNKYYYEDGRKIIIDFTYSNNYSEQHLLEPLKSESEDVNIPKNIIEKAIKIVNEKIKSYLEREKIVYLESIRPCELKIQIPTKWKGNDNHYISTVIPLQKPSDKVSSPNPPPQTSKRRQTTKPPAQKKSKGKYSHIKPGQKVILSNGTCAKKLSNGQLRFIKKDLCN